MEDAYHKLREQLRRQQSMNDQELRLRSGEHLVENRYESFEEESGFSLGSRILLFVTCIMLFSCYLYGGQDVRKGAQMAWKDMNDRIMRMEEERPAVRQVMNYVRRAYDGVKDQEASDHRN